MDGGSGDDHSTQNTKRGPKAREAAPRAAPLWLEVQAVRVGAGGHKTLHQHGGTERAR